MFNKKIIASALIGSLAFTLFPTNIFANNSLSEAERKICENKDDILYFDINGNDLFTIFNDINKRGEKYLYNDSSYMTKNGEKVGNNYISMLLFDNTTWHGGPVTKAINGDFYDLGVNRNLETIFIKNGKDLNFNFGSITELKINEDGDFIYLKNNKLYKNNEEIKLDEENLKVMLANRSTIINKNGNFVHISYKNGILDYYINGEKIDILRWPNEPTLIPESVKKGEFVFGLDTFNGGRYYKNNVELNLPKNFDLDKIIEEGKYVFDGYDTYFYEENKQKDKFKVYKNSNIIYENIKSKTKSFKNIKLDKNGNLYIFLSEYENTGIIYKNGKAICGEIEDNGNNDSGNSDNNNGNNNGNNNSGNSDNNNGNSDNNNGNSPVSNPEDLKLKNDPRVLDQNNSSNSTKTEETKKEEKISENKKSENNSLTESEKNSIKILVENIFKKYSNNKNLLENLYKALTTREDILKIAEKNPRVKFVIEEYKKQYSDFMIKL